MSRGTRRSIRFAVPAVIGALLVSVVGPSAGAAHAPIGLGTATSFAVLAGSGITNDIPGTVITGDVGSFPTTTISNTGNWTLNGVNHGGDAVTQSAKNDLQTAFDDASGRLPVTAQDAELGGEVKTPGVYGGPTLGLTGVLTLDFGNDVDALFVFKAASTLTTAAGSSVVLIGAAADPCRVVWVVGSSATYGANSTFVGDALVHTSISANTGATFQGRLLALNGAVTLLDNTITRTTCVAPAAATTTTSSTSTTSTTVRRTTTSSTSTTSTTLAAPTTTSTVLRTSATTAVASVGGPTTPPGADLQVVDAPPSAPAAPTAPTAPPSVPELPRTGSDTTLLAVIGVLMVLLGAAIVRTEKRTRRSRAR